MLKADDFISRAPMNPSWKDLPDAPGPWLWKMGVCFQGVVEIECYGDVWWIETMDGERSELTPFLDARRRAPHRFFGPIPEDTEKR